MSAPRNGYTCLIVCKSREVRPGTPLPRPRVKPPSHRQTLRRGAARYCRGGGCGGAIIYECKSRGPVQVGFRCARLFIQINLQLLSGPVIVTSKLSSCIIRFVYKRGAAPRSWDATPRAPLDSSSRTLVHLPGGSARGRDGVGPHGEGPGPHLGFCDSFVSCVRVLSIGGTPVGPVVSLGVKTAVP